MTLFNAFVGRIRPGAGFNLNVLRPHDPPLLLGRQGWCDTAYGARAV